MEDRKRYLSALKNDLSGYKKKLATISDSGDEKTDKKRGSLVKSLEDKLEGAAQFYEKLESASEEEWATLKKEGAKIFDTLKETFDEVTEAASDNIKQFVFNVEEYAKGSVDSTSDYIQKNPFKSLLLVGALGYFMGKVSR